MAGRRCERDDRRPDPDRNRPAALAVTLTALGAQTWPALRIVVADQSDGHGACACGEVRAVLRYLRATGRSVDTFHRTRRRGMAEQRAFLLAQARSAYCLFLDDDVILEPDLVARLYAVIREERCGLVGSALHGVSYLGQLRPAQEAIEFWDGPFTPETVRPGSASWHATAAVPSCRPAPITWNCRRQSRHGQSTRPMCCRWPIPKDDDMPKATCPPSGDVRKLSSCG